jgi:zinc-dependent metalloproteinase lipoprotein
MRNYLLCFLALMLFGFFASAQDKCLSHKNEMEMRAKHPHLGTVENFEAWLAKKTKERKSNSTAQRGGTYKVPVIIHVIHAGDAIANGSVNIPYGQATSQIRVLNEDFKRTNLDASSTRAIFAPKAGSLNITFELATVDPTGVPLSEPGVERINSQTRFSKSSWSTAECDATLKPQTIWDPARYANIWVVKFSGTDDTGLFGYAQFPEGSTLPGVPTGGTATTDGCVINYRSFGSNYKADGTPVTGGPYMPATALISAGTDRGRTLTHEIGHWLGLRHIWGDLSGCGNANSDDYCTDTPDVTGSAPLNATCSTPQARNTCSTLESDYANADVADQIENYMDYSADICMNMFSVAQLARVETVLLNASRRKELLTSITAAPVDPSLIFANFTSNKSSGCVPLVVTFTDGSIIGGTAATITSWNWNFDKTSLGGVSQASFSGKIPPAITFSNGGTYTIELNIGNGTKTSSYNIQIVTSKPTPTLPIVQGFETSISPFKEGSNGAGGTWKTVSTAKYSGAKSVKMDLYDVDITGKEVYLDVPSINFVNFTSAQISFYIAYQRFSATENTKLALQYSTDCGTTYTELWNKSNDALATVTGFDPGPFTPSGTTQWRQETVNLASLPGNSNVKLRWVLTDEYSDNIYLDDINITGVATLVNTPTTLTATSTVFNSVGLTWTDNSSNEDGFKIERSTTTGSGFTQIGTVGANIVTYTDNTTDGASKYYYRVRSYLTSNNSNYSNEATVTTPQEPITAPTALAATATTDAKIKLDWTDNSNNEQGFKIERSTSETSGFAVVGTSVAATFTDNAIDLGTTYYYRVRAYKNLSFSAYSNVSNNNISRLTAIDDELSKALSVYPNPAVSNFTVKLEGIAKKDVKATLYNALGQEIQQKAITTQEITFSTNSLQKGVYLLRIQTDNGLVNRKVVIE